MFACAGTLLSAGVVRRFGKAATPVTPLRASTALVVDGPYRYTRNPDYIGQTLTAGSFDRIEPRLAGVVPAGGADGDRPRSGRARRAVSDAEVGSAYLAYMMRVPRWL
jgi:protein-S-isoprenylcysteine O-methyltransferase Ste14